MTSNGDAFGSLAALFSSGGEDSAAAPNPRLQADASHSANLPFDSVVTVLVGNLPVMAGLWTTQFADAIGRVAGPTCLVRFERDDLTVELLRASGRSLPAPGARALERWLPRGAAMVRRWIVCLAAETPPAEVLAGGTEVLVMTGADEAAVTAAYLRIKHLVEAALQQGAPLERVGVVLVGASPEQADLSASRLADAARSFLGIDIDVIARIPRLERVESSASATYPVQESPPYTAFMSALARARHESAHRFDTPETVPELARAPDAAAAPAPARSASPAEPARLVESKVDASTTAAAGTPARLASLLTGLRPLGITCPVAPEVELAVDASGRMHVIGRADQLARVRTARHWAQVHRELLGLAFAEFRHGFEVRERILLNDARDAIALHGTGVLLDLLVDAQTPSGRVQLVVPLNDAATCG